jgi:hypothetical protein
MSLAIALNALFALVFVGLWSAGVWLTYRSLGQPAVRAHPIQTSPESGLRAAQAAATRYPSPRTVITTSAPSFRRRRRTYTSTTLEPGSKW